MSSRMTRTAWKPGQELNIPPADGLLYRWKEGDTIEKVAAQYRAKPEDIINWPGNNLDLSDPRPQPGQWVMIPGGSARDQSPDGGCGQRALRGDLQCAV